MFAYSITNYHFFETNEGINKEQCLDFHYNGKHDKHDNLPWNEGSDLPEQRMSVKSAKFSLCSYGQLNGDGFEAKLDDFFARVASIRFAYITKEYVVYEMNATEFRMFLERFSYLSEVKKSGGKIKGKGESKIMLEWLAEMAV